MPVTFKVPKSPAKSVYKIDQFKGVDFSNSPINVDDNKSPNAINMIRDVPDKVRKRMGFEVVEDYSSYGTNILNYVNIQCDTQLGDIFVSGKRNGTSTYDFLVLADNCLVASYNSTNKYAAFNTTTQVGWSVPNDFMANHTDIRVQTDQLIKITSPLEGRPVAAGNYYFEYIPHSLGIKSGQGKLTFWVVAGTENPAQYEIVIDDVTRRQTLPVTLYSTNEVKVYVYLTQLGISGNCRIAGLSFGINLIKASEYTPDMDYIPAGRELIPHGYEINGCHYRREDPYPIYHIGTNMIQNGTLLYSSANNAISHSWQLGDSLYILDGKKMLVYDGTNLQPVQNVAFVPTVLVNKDPDGGRGVFSQSYNVIGTGWEEGFCVTPATETATQFYLARNQLDATTVKVRVMNAQGGFDSKTEGVDFSVDRTNGIVTFFQAPGKSYSDGHDNVFITAYKTIQDDLDKVNKCTFGIRFGVNGAFDRLFVSGNPNYPNGDWHSGMWDGTYYPDSSYAVLGSQKSAVVGYSIVSNYLAAHKDELEEDLAVIIREGDLIDDEPSFRIINTLQGQGAIATNSFSYLSTEPIFLTRSGLYAITAQDITGEKYSQSRSFYLNGKLCEEEYKNLQKSISVIYNDMYILCVNELKNPTDPDDKSCYSRLYILDGLQPMRTDKSEPYSTRQYAAFYCEMEDINCMWEKENRLYFGTVTGKICRFYKDKSDINSYNDDGEPIYCCWETPDIDGQLFYKNKSLRYVAIRVGSALATSVKIYAMERGIWKFVKQDNTFARYFSFENLQFSKFAFSGNKTPQISRTKLRIKRVDKYRLRFVNEELNEPFTLYNIANEYTESGNYKG